MSSYDDSDYLKIQLKAVNENYFIQQHPLKDSEED